MIIRFEDCYFDYGYFETSARVLAAPPRAQARVYPPFADITFELADDFDKSTDYEGYREFAKTIAPEQLSAIEDVKAAIDDLEPLDWDWNPDNIEDILDRPAWQRIRFLAEKLLCVFEIELGEIPAYSARKRHPRNNPYLFESTAKDVQGRTSTPLVLAVIAILLGLVFSGWIFKESGYHFYWAVGLTEKRVVELYGEPLRREKGIHDGADYLDYYTGFLYFVTLKIRDGKVTEVDIRPDD